MCWNVSSKHAVIPWKRAVPCRPFRTPYSVRLFGVFACTLRRRAFLCCYIRTDFSPRAKFRSRGCSHKTPTCTAADGESRWGWRHAGLVRRRSPAPLTPGFPLRATEEGGTEEEEDALELTKGFYSEVKG